MEHDIQGIVKHFKIAGSLLNAEIFGSGIINDTYNLTFNVEGSARRYIFQRINHRVFKNPMEVMENISRITEHIRNKMRNQEPTLALRQLVVVETENGTGCFEDENGNYWRAYNRVENAVTHDTLESPQMAYEAARMFGWFQRMLTDLPEPPLHDTIPDFHDTPKRFQAFQDILRRDPHNRAQGAKPEIDFVLKHTEICNVLLNQAEQGFFPVRITHNDTKINNVMLDENTCQGICVIDLDTVMPGLSLYDFGDMVRTATSPVSEDEQNLSKVTMRMPIFEMLVRGFSRETHAFLTPVERKHLAFSGKLITWEQMIRFLGDHLAGDSYYKIHRDNHNLDRCRTQMALIQSMFDQEEAMNTLVDSVFEELA